MEYIITNNNNKNTKMCIYYLTSWWNELMQIVMKSRTTQNPIWEIVFWKWIKNGLVKNKDENFLHSQLQCICTLGFNHLMKYLEPKFYYEILVQLPTTWNHHYGTLLIWSTVSPNKMNIACHSSSVRSFHYYPVLFELLMSEKCFALFISFADATL